MADQIQWAMILVTYAFAFVLVAAEWIGGRK